MRIAPIFLIACCAFSGLVQAEVPPLEARAPNAKAWVGQRVPFFVDLRSKGSFSGTASFDLPRIPGTLVIKIGSPVVDTQKLDDEEWFIQRHEFALFSQKSGEVKIPAFSVRFSRRDGFTGPVSEIEAQTSILTLEIERPPGSEKIGFLVSTDSLDITETWDPPTGPAKVGAIFKRTITQRAEHLPGMALAPVPTGEPDGIGLYPGPVETKDDLYRGAFIGERSETITYLLQESGTLTVPALTYAWWNPETETLQSKTLPAVTFEVAASSVSEATGEAVATRPFWPWLLAAALLVGLITWRRLVAWGRGGWRKLNPPDRVAARELLRACHRHDAKAAQAAWIAWRNTQGARFQPEPELRDAILGMQRFLFGRETESSWQGEELARVFARKSSAVEAGSACKSESTLPLLNPRSREW